jgi:hypothetical protein
VTTEVRGIGIGSCEVFDDAPMVAAVVPDRVLHRPAVINIDGSSHRMRTHRARADATGQAGAR